MKLIFNENNFSQEGFFQINNNTYIYFEGSVIYQNNLYIDNEFYPILINIIENNILEDIIVKFNGNFNIILYKNNKITIANDRWGSFPLYFFHNQKKIAISNDWKKIIPYTNKSFNETSLLEYISFGYVLGNKTLIQNLEEFQAHSIYEFKFINNNLVKKHNSYWSFEYSFKQTNSKEKEKEFSDLWLKQIAIYANYLKNKSNLIFLPLSGGLDSRLLAAAFNKHNIEMHTMTWVFQNNMSQLYRAKEVIKKISNITKHEIFYLDDKNTVDLYNSSVPFNLITNGRSGIETYYFYQYIKDIPYIIPGFSGDFMAGSHLQYKMKNWKKKQDIINYIKKFKFSPIINNITNNRTFFEETITNSLEQTISSDKDLISSFIAWDLEQRQRRYIIQSGNIHNKTRQIIPFFDYKLIDFFLNLSFEDLLNTKLYINSQINYLYKNHYNNELIKIKRDEKVQKKIKTNLIYEYKSKMKKVIKNKISTKKNTETNYFKPILDKLELPPELDKYNIKYQYNHLYTFYLVNIGKFYKQLKEL